MTDNASAPAVKPGHSAIDTNSIVRRLADIQLELSGLHHDEALTLVAEVTTKIAAWFGCEDTRLNFRDKVAEHAAQQYTTDLIRIRGSIRALHEERDHLRIELNYFSHA